MKLKTLLLASSVAATSAMPAAAEINFGGWMGYETNNYNGAWGTENYQHLRLDGLLSYDSGDFVLGVGVAHDFASYDGDPFTSDDDGIYYLLGYGDVTVTFGEFWGAGNIFPEDYFGMDDTTSKSDETLRVDFAYNGQQFAISYDTDSGDSNDFELGYRGSFYGFDVVVGYEGDTEDLGVIVGQDMGNWGWQVATIQDLDGTPNNDHYGATVFYDVMEGLSVAANYAVEGDGDLEGWGVVATYDLGIGTVKAEYLKHGYGDSNIEVGIVIPFGATQPSADARFSLKEYNRGLIY